MLEIKTRHAGGVTVLDVSGALIWRSGMESLSQRVRQLVAEQRLNVVVNVQGLSVIDSSGVGELVASFSTLKRAGGALKVAGPTKLVQDVLRIARIPTIIEVYDTEEAAVNAFSA